VAVAIVAGAVANKPLNGGEAWVRMSWALGLRRLGFEVFFLEALSAAACVDEEGRPTPFERSVNRVHFEAVMEEFSLRETSVLLDERGEARCGVSTQELAEVAAEADVLFDLSGHLGELAHSLRPRRRVYVDLDPGFTQAWHCDPELPFTIAGYDHYVTVGTNVGASGCPIPTAGLDWIPTLPPIPLKRWADEPRPSGPRPPSEPAHPASGPPGDPSDDTPQTPRPDARLPRFTTVSTWRSPHGPVTVDGRTPGLKHHEFRRMIEIPAQVEDAAFELALHIDAADAADREALQEHRWRIVDPRAVAGTPAAFRDYVRGSFAEISVAQGVYVDTGCGWFSDRTGAYLAAGRPALVQDTGIAGRLPIGEGLLTFATPQEAAQAARQILADPAGHSQAARRIAETHLDSDLVLGRLLETVGVG
jgi:hypothetical protein